jgi:hypothetical protein
MALGETGGATGVDAETGALDAAFSGPDRFVRRRSAATTPTMSTTITTVRTAAESGCLERTLSSRSMIRRPV